MKTKDITQCALFVAIIAIGAFIRIPIPYIPFTLQITFVSLAGILLGSRRGALCCLVYMILGLVGLPIFTQGGGIGYLIQPTFGYIIGFIFGAWITGFIIERDVNPSYGRLIIASLIGMSIIYACGLIYFYCIANFYLALSLSVWYIVFYGFLAVVPGNLVCMFFAAYLAKRLLPITRKSFSASPRRGEKDNIKLSK